MPLEHKKDDDKINQSRGRYYMPAKMNRLPRILHRRYLAIPPLRADSLAGHWKSNTISAGCDICLRRTARWERMYLAEKILVVNPLAQIILVSPETPQLSQEDVLKAGFSAWLRFPLNGETVRQVLDNHLRRSWYSKTDLRGCGSGAIRWIPSSQIRDGMIIVAEDGKLAMVNRAARKALGVEQDEWR